MNTRIAPFNDPRVRQAIDYGVDRPALAKQFGGLLEIDCNFLPPGMLGYSKIDACPWGDPHRAPDLTRASELLRQAGARGAKVTVWGIDEEPTKALTEVYADQLNRIGLAARPKLLSGDVYFQTIGNQDTKAQTGFANWFEDFPHPADFFSLVDGAAIQQTNNHNYGDVNDPVLNAQIAKLNAVADLPSVADRWAALDRLLVSRAYIVPYGHRKLTTVMSDRMDFKRCNVFNPVFHHDYSSFCLK
jgi:peptide/nickel transport system substrate-binding protein